MKHGNDIIKSFLREFNWEKIFSNGSMLTAYVK